MTLKIHVFGIRACMTETDKLEFNVQQRNIQYFLTMNIYNFRHLIRSTKGCVHYHNFISIFILLRLTYTIVTKVRSTDPPKLCMCNKNTKNTNDCSTRNSYHELLQQAICQTYVLFFCSPLSS